VDELASAHSCQCSKALRMMKIEVIAVRGRCNAGLAVGDTFLLHSWHIISGNANKMCCVALASIIACVSRWKLHDGAVCVSCPDPGTGEGGNVLFRLCQEEGYENHQC
jgi:uncharacterized repeat protein (TIGR04076 family)